MALTEALAAVASWMTSVPWFAETRPSWAVVIWLLTLSSSKERFDCSAVSCAIRFESCWPAVDCTPSEARR